MDANTIVKILKLTVSVVLIFLFIKNYFGNKNTEISHQKQADMSLEEQLKIFSELGLEINMKADINKNHLLGIFEREDYEKQPFNLLMHALGSTIEREPWTPISNDVYSFDTECVEDEGVYVEALENLMRLSGGELLFTNMQDHIKHGLEAGEGDPEERGKAWISFDFAGKSHKIDLEYYYDWFDMELFHHLNQLIDKAGIDKRIYFYNTGDQVAVLLWLEKEQAKSITKKTGLLLEQLVIS